MANRNQTKANNQSQIDVATATANLVESSLMSASLTKREIAFIDPAWMACKCFRKRQF